MAEILVAILLGLVLLIALHLKRKYKYWTNRDVHQLEPAWVFGNLSQFMFGNQSFGDMISSWYNEFKKKGLPYGGTYFFSKPIFVPVDPELIKKIVASDFASFNSHAGILDDEGDPLNSHLFNLEGHRWKEMRAKLTPTFTSGKMKMMFNTIRDCSVGLSDIFDHYAQTKESVEVKDILGRYTTDVIGSCAFGIDCNSIKDPDTEFRIFGKKVFYHGFVQQLNMFLLHTLPLTLSHYIGVKQVRPDIERFFIKVVSDTVKYREEHNIVRKDFMHLLLQLKNQGKISDTDDFKAIENEDKQGITMNELAAQAFVFFLAGFETSSTTMTFALLELASHQDVQDKLRQEINETLKKYNGEITYESILEMKLLDKVINETLRMHTPLPFLPRKCIKDYKIPNTNLIIENGTMIQIPIQALHMDPEYYPEPEKFDPERFSEENKAKRPAFTYLPFGDGPRVCIGLRFGVLQSKIGLIAILRNHVIKLDQKKTPLPIKLDVKSIIKSTDGGVWVTVNKI